MGEACSVGATGKVTRLNTTATSIATGGAQCKALPCAPGQITARCQ